MTYKISVSPLSSLQYHITVCFSEVGYKESAEMSEFWMCYEIFILIIFFFLFLYLYQYVLKQFLCHDQDISEYFSFLFQTLTVYLCILLIEFPTGRLSLILICVLFTKTSVF